MQNETGFWLLSPKSLELGEEYFLTAEMCEGRGWELNMV